MSKETLLIIGNGFDLKCGLDSRYIDLFNYKTKEYPKFNSFIEYLKSHKKNSFSDHNIDEIIALMPLEEDITFFDVYFSVSDWAKGKLNSDRIWSNIEDILLEGINGSGDSISYNICHSVYSSIGTKDYKTFYQYLYSEKIIAHYINKVFLNKKISERKYCNYLIEELNRFSVSLAEYINKQTKDNDDYINKAQKLLTKITGVALNECDILSFNYTDPFISPFLVNIHGLARKKDIVFGITCGEGAKKVDAHNNWSYKLTKEYKMALVMSKGQKVSIERKGIKEIYVYGLSLGWQDYDFFENLFDECGFLNRSYSVKIHFCYSEYGNKTIDEAAEEMTQRVARLINNYGDSHKVYGLFRSMMQNGALDIKPVK